MGDTILCRDKEDAKNCIDNIGCNHIADWEFFPDGKVKLILDCKVEQLKEQKNEVG